MFACRACTRRALSILFETSIPPESSSTSLRKCIASRTSSVARTYTTSAITVPDSKVRNTKPWGHGSDGERSSRGPRLTPTERSVNKQLQYLDDPFHIAKEVERILAKDAFEEAAMLVRKASNNHQVAVSWNHLIDHQLRAQRLHAAIKLYNEMKKRGQQPTAQTYTIIFRGCAASQHAKLAVAEAMKLYNNMLRSDRINPNIVHMNALLHVCARAEDIETMFGVIKSADATIRQPNNLTYTTILNALRARVNKPRPEAELEDVWSARIEEERTQTIERAKAIWDEVLSKWRSASLVMDEALVCAMGRILLMGNYFDNNDVFALVDQTMGIPKEPEKLSNLAWKGAKEDLMSSSESKVAKSTTRNLTKSENPVSPGSLARPGQNSLSLIMSAIQNTGKANYARRYWLIFTKNHAVVPDAENWSSLFRALRRGKSSSKAAEYLDEMPKELRLPKVFRTVMATCLRDNINKSSFNNATRVLEIMITTLRIPDMVVLRDYLRVAYANKRLFEEMAKTKDPATAKLAWGRQLCVALENLWEPYQIAAKQLTHGGLTSVPDKKFVEEKERQVWVQEATLRAEVAALARKMIAAHDRLIFDNMVPPEVAKRLEPRRNALNRFVVKYFEDRERIEPGWNRKVQEIEAKREEEDGDWGFSGAESS